ncbi:hypothetical protein II906_04790, partial [bacterium]|nr:hypothetical protein [bacterium]
MKHLSILILIVICLSSAYLFYDKGSYHKVFSVDSPVSIYVDLNSNLIRDEKEPFYISDIFFADRNKDYSSDKDFKSVPFEKILIADFYAKQTAENLLHNKFIKIKDNDL